MKYLLDTNTCIYFLNQRYPKLTQKLLRVGRARICVSALTIAELEYGAANSTRVEANQARIECFANEVQIVDFDLSMARLFGTLKAKIKQAGRRIGEFDLAIAASAITTNTTVVTHDADFQKVPGLITEDWTS
jgi:tRNA(fMet)-specific endonuclease VapC